MLHARWFAAPQRASLAEGAVRHRATEHSAAGVSLRPRQARRTQLGPGSRAGAHARSRSHAASRVSATSSDQAACAHGCGRSGLSPSCARSGRAPAAPGAALGAWPSPDGAARPRARSSSAARGAARKTTLSGRAPWAASSAACARAARPHHPHRHSGNILCRLCHRKHLHTTDARAEASPRANMCSSFGTSTSL